MLHSLAHGLAVTDSHGQSSHTSSGPQNQVRSSQLGLNLVLSLGALCSPLSVSWDAEGLPPNGCHETALIDSLDVLIRSLSAHGEFEDS